MLRKLPGIDIPAATESTILHTAAFLEFKQHLERLAREGLDLAAYTCWMHAVEIRHSPVVFLRTSESELFPPLVKMPSCKRNCQRCAAQLGRFKFPWVGLWNTRGIIIPPDVQPGDAWAYYYKRLGKMGLLLVAAYANLRGSF